MNPAKDVIVPINWDDSTTYQWILRKGEVKGAVQEARAALLAVGTARCGQPSAEVETAVNSQPDIARLRRMMQVAIHATAWAEVLATP